MDEAIPQLLQQFQQLLEAPMHIANDVERPMLAAPIHPQGNAVNDGLCDFFGAAQDVQVAHAALDVLEALLRRLGRSGATLAAEEPLRDLTPREHDFALTTPTRVIAARRVILDEIEPGYNGYSSSIS